MNEMREMREMLKNTVISWAFGACQPDKGDIFAWLDDNADELAEHLAKATLQSIPRISEEELDEARTQRDAAYNDIRDLQFQIRDAFGTLRYILAQAKANHPGLNHVVAQNVEQILARFPQLVTRIEGE